MKRKSAATTTLAPSQTKPASAPNNPRGKRSVKLATIYSSLGSQQIEEGVVLDLEEVKKLARWVCKWDLFGMHPNQIGPPETDRLGQVCVGYCDECLNHAAFLLAECPYFDMTRGDEVEIEMILP